MTARLRVGILAVVAGLIAAGPVLSIPTASHAHAQAALAKKAHKKKKKKAHKKSGSSGSQQVPKAGTIQLSGSMSTDSTLVMTGALSVGHATDLDWDLPLPQSVQINGYTEQVDPPSFRWSVPPDSTSDLAVGSNMVRRFHWDAPAAKTVIQVTETLHAVARTDLTPFTSTAAFPLSTPPDGVRPYAQQTNDTALPPDATQEAETLVQGATTEQQAATQIADYVASHTNYAHDPATKIDAASVWASHTGLGEGYTNLMAGMLRQVGIPVRIEFGWVSATPIQFPTGIPKSTISVTWSVPNSAGEMHDWLEMYFPDVGWVPFDAQAEKFFVDPRHLALFTNSDADLAHVVDSQGNMWLGRYTGYADASNDPLLTPNLPGGASDVVPGFGPAGSVTLQQTVNDQMTFVKWIQDVNNVYMFTR